MSPFKWTHPCDKIFSSAKRLPPSFEDVNMCARQHIIYCLEQGKKNSFWGKLFLKMNMKRALTVKRTPMIVFICYCIATTFFTLLATNDVSWLVQHTIRHSTLILWPFSLQIFLRNTIITILLKSISKCLLPSHLDLQFYNCQSGHCCSVRYWR